MHISRLIQEYDNTPSIARRDNYLDNPCIENFLGLIKTE